MAGEPAEQASGALVVARVPRSVALIRRFAVARCTESGFGGECDTMALLVSEVATNVLVHRAGDVRAAVSEGDGALSVEVTDAWRCRHGRAARRWFEVRRTA